MRITILALLAVLAGCVSARFSVVGENEYQLTKMSDACAIGMPSLALANLREEAMKFCAGRKEAPIEIETKTHVGIPAIRCASATLRFRCATPPPP